MFVYVTEKFGVIKERKEEKYSHKGKEEKYSHKRK
jgi:hypothetical protein